jgi:apolipoprotein D and lipocalin family protein
MAWDRANVRPGQEIKIPVPAMLRRIAAAMKPRPRRRAARLARRRLRRARGVRTLALTMRFPWLAAIFCLALPACANEPLDTAPNVDLARFQGRWFEIAKLPRVTQADCTGTIAFYTLRDGGMDVVNECHLGKLDGELRSSAAHISSASGDTAAKMSIDVHGFTGDYWILEVGEHYEYAVVGVPSRDYLWILSRTPALEKATLDAVVQRMRANKFDTSRLEYTLQGP